MRTFFLRIFGFLQQCRANFRFLRSKSFLIEKILINVRILRDLSRVAILFILGLYRLGLVMRHKPFPFRVTWRSLKIRWMPRGLQIRLPCVCALWIRSLLAHSPSTVMFIQMDLSSLILGPQSRNHTSKHLGLSTKYLTTYLFVYHISQRNVTMKV